MLTRHTTAVRVSCEPRRTFAVGSMAAHCALSIGGTRIVNSARIHTGSVLARLSESALFIARATHLNGLSYKHKKGRIINWPSSFLIC